MKEKDMREELTGKYEEVRDFSMDDGECGSIEITAVRLKNGKWGLINRYGEENFPCTYASSEAAKQKWSEMNRNQG